MIGEEDLPVPADSLATLPCVLERVLRLPPSLFERETDSHSLIQILLYVTTGQHAVVLEESSRAGSLILKVSLRVMQSAVRTISAQGSVH